jgi:hypothetical protein
MLDGRWIAGTIQDPTQQCRDQEKIRYLTNYDSLTVGASLTRVEAQRDRFGAWAVAKRSEHSSETLDRVLFLAQIKGSSIRHGVIDDPRNDTTRDSGA